MTVLVRGTRSYFMGAQAFLLDDQVETASDWASKFINPNPAIKWVLGKYAEADNPNGNRQAWALEDLRLGQPTIANAPMNMLHQRNNIVGSFVATEMLYPTDDAADDMISNPYVEALGAFWHALFPEAYAAVEQAHNEGKLFFSMECVSKDVRFESADGTETETFPYMGPQHASYGERWNADRAATRWFEQPQFMGGALIIPPVRPGWSGAEIKSLAQYVEAHAEMADEIYKGLEKSATHLTPKEIEHITLELMKGEAGVDLSELRNSINSDIAPNTESDTSSDRDDSLEGGDNVSDKTYTEEEVAAAAAKAAADAVAPVQAELDAIKAEKEAEGVEAQIATLKEQYEGEVAELQKSVDVATAKAAAAEAEKDDVLAYLEGEKAAAEAVAEITERTEARVAAVKEVASFSDEYVEANSERWATMDEAAFASLIDDLTTTAEVAAKGSSEGEGAGIGATAMGAGVETAGAEGGRKFSGGAAEFMRASRMGLNPLTV